MAIGARLRLHAPVVAVGLSIALALAVAWAPSAVAAASTSLVSVASDGAQGNDPSSDPASSGDGRVVAFDSIATNLVPGDTNAKIDIFVRDRQAAQTTRVSVASDGTQANDLSVLPAVSGEGRYVAFESDATNLVAGDSNGRRDIFVRDRQSAQTTRVSVASDGTQGSSEFGFSQGADASISADGRFVAFQAGFTNLVAGDTNTCVSLPNLPPGECPDIFVHDRQTGQTTRVSVASDGTQANDQSFRPAISADGRYVAFASVASNLVPGDTNGAQGVFLGTDVFVHDRQTGQTTRVSVAADGTQANRESFAPTVSADGRYVAFLSLASNLVARDSNGRRDPLLGQDVFVHDRLTGQTTRVSVAADGRQALGPASTPRSAPMGGGWRSPPRPAIWCSWIATGSGMSLCATARREPPSGSVSPLTARRPTTRAPFPRSAATGLRWPSFPRRPTSWLGMPTKPVTCSSVSWRPSLVGTGMGPTFRAVDGAS
jgi:Tol biopolymer transport system component